MLGLINLLPDNGRVVLDVIDGDVSNVTVLTVEHHIATLSALIELLKEAGYTVTTG